MVPKVWGGMEVKGLSKLKALEEENARLKKMYANLSLVHEVFKEAVEKKRIQLFLRTF